MKTEKVSIHVSDSIGKVSGELILPDAMTSLLVLAHGAGAGMNHTFMVTLAKKLAEESIATLRYNFPYMENKKGRPDVPAIAEKTVHSAITFANEKFPNVPLFAGGKSFGGRMTSGLASKSKISFLKGLVFFGFPLHAPGKASTERAEHLKSVPQPMLFLQGSRDALAELNLIQQVVKQLPNSTLEVFEGADHSFKAGKKQFMEELGAATKSWIASGL